MNERQFASKASAGAFSRSISVSFSLRVARSVLLAALTEFPCGETSRVIRESAGVSGGRFKDLIGDLIDDGLAENCEIKRWKSVVVCQAGDSETDERRQSYRAERS